MKRWNAIIAMIALIVVSSTVGCSFGYSEAERAYNDGNDLYKQRLYAAAIPDYTKAIRLTPDSASAAATHVFRGAAYYKLGQYAAAEADKAKACSLDSQFC